jgi:hypothetical protein
MSDERLHVESYIQEQLRRRRMPEVTAVEAARWLDSAQVLRDSPSRPGLPLSSLLRAGAIEAAEQRPARPYGRWFIVRAASDASRYRVEIPFRAATNARLAPPYELGDGARVELLRVDPRPEDRRDAQRPVTVLFTKTSRFRSAYGFPDRIGRRRARRDPPPPAPCRWPS